MDDNLIRPYNHQPLLEARFQQTDRLLATGLAASVRDLASCLV